MTTMRSVVFDIETGPVSQEMLELAMPQFEAPANFKDPLKIEAAIAAKKTDWLTSAALSPLTGRVIAIGVIEPGAGFGYIAGDDEAQILRRFWTKLLQHSQLPVIGFNIAHFDIPFLLRRSFKHGVTPVPCFRGRYLSDRFVDLMQVWQCGDYKELISLNALAKFLGAGEKTGSGADFARLWETDRQLALEYLRKDCELVVACAQKMGISL